MDISYLLTFLGGMAADIARKLIVPQTEEWLESILPYKRKARNVQQNLLRLEVREKLAKMGHDPSLARHVEEDAEKFWRRLEQRHEAQREALVELEADRLLSGAETQIEMNMASAERSREAEELLAVALEKLTRKGDLSESAQEALGKAQAAWLQYRNAQAHFEGIATAEGGSMQPMIEASHRADMTIDRILNISALRKALTH